MTFGHLLAVVYKWTWNNKGGGIVKSITSVVLRNVNSYNLVERKFWIDIYS